MSCSLSLLARVPCLELVEVDLGALLLSLLSFPLPICLNLATANNLSTFLQGPFSFQPPPLMTLMLPWPTSPHPHFF